MQKILLLRKIIEVSPAISVLATQWKSSFISTSRALFSDIPQAPSPPHPAEPPVPIPRGAVCTEQSAARQGTWLASAALPLPAVQHVDAVIAREGAVEATPWQKGCGAPEERPRCEEPALVPGDRAILLVAIAGGSLDICRGFLYRHSSFPAGGEWAVKFTHALTTCCLDYCEMFMSKCKPIAIRIRAAHSRNSSNQNASLLSSSLRGMRSHGILTPSVFCWAAQLPAWEPAALLQGGVGDLSAGSLKTLGLPPEKSEQAQSPAPLPRLVEWEAPSMAHGQLTPLAGLGDEGGVSPPLYTLQSADAGCSNNTVMRIV